MDKNDNKNKQRVFVLQEHGKYNVDAVKYYSKEIVYIVQEERINPFDTFSLIELIWHRLKVEKFNPHDDFICLTGSSVLLALYLSVITRYCSHCEQFKVLIYDAKKNNYKLRMINLGV